MTLEGYLDYLSRPKDQLANETFYLFGNNYDGIWKTMSDAYVLPRGKNCENAGLINIIGYYNQY